MHLDVTDLRDFYARPIGHIARRVLVRRLRDHWPSVKGETVIGLVQMLSNLSDPTKIGAGMAGALVGTFYGAFVANMIMLPMAGKLEIRAKEETRMRELMIEGIVAIQSGEKPALIREKLAGFLAPAERARLEV